jgi:acetate kinase
MEKAATIVAINSGSSSLKFKLFSSTDPPRHLISGSMTGIGSAKISFRLSPNKVPEISLPENGVESTEKAAAILIDWLKQQVNDFTITAIGHRVVQGGLQFSKPEPINADFLSKLKELEPLAPLHLPDAISVMHLFLQAFPDVPQLACFDTWFHKDMPFEARYFALPRQLWKEGIIRYGFHGLSCQYILEHLQQADSFANQKKIIVAHFGSGCSLTAVTEGISIDTTMSFTPASGIMMQSRSGDIDSNIVTYLMEKKAMNTSKLVHLFNNESGLKAISATNDPMQELIEKQNADQKAEEAIRMFCYQAKKNIGALVAALGGLDILVFTGGIGEHEPIIRANICKGLECFGIRLNEKLNKESASEIAEKDSPISVRVIATDEEFIIAKETMKLLQHQEQNN